LEESARHVHVVARVLKVGDHPLVDLIRPLSTTLKLHVLQRWNELIDDQVLQTDLSRQLSDPVHQVFTLLMDHLSEVFDLSLGMLEAASYSVGFLVNVCDFLLNRAELLFDVKFHLLLLGQLLFHDELLAAALLNLSFCLEKLLLLFHGFLHCFGTVE
jgi:hypothetical protein